MAESNNEAFEYFGGCFDFSHFRSWKLVRAMAYILPFGTSQSSRRRMEGVDCVFFGWNRRRSLKREEGIEDDLTWNWERWGQMTSMLLRLPWFTANRHCRRDYSIYLLLSLREKQFIDRLRYQWKKCRCKSLEINQRSEYSIIPSSFQVQRFMRLRVGPRCHHGVVLQSGNSPIRDLSWMTVEYFFIWAMRQWFPNHPKNFDWS